MDGGSEEPSCAAFAPRREGSCEDCGDSGGVPSRLGGSVYDDVVNRVLRARARVDIIARWSGHLCSAAELSSSTLCMVSAAGVDNAAPVDGHQAAGSNAELGGYCCRSESRPLQAAPQPDTCLYSGTTNTAVKNLAHHGALSKGLQPKHTLRRWPSARAIWAARAPTRTRRGGCRRGPCPRGCRGSRCGGACRHPAHITSSRYSDSRCTGGNRTGTAEGLGTECL